MSISKRAQESKGVIRIGFFRESLFKFLLLARRDFGHGVVCGNFGKFSGSGVSPITPPWGILQNNVRHCPKLQCCAISRKTNDANLRQWRKP